MATVPRHLCTRHAKLSSRPCAAVAIFSARFARTVYTSVKARKPMTTTRPAAATSRVVRQGHTPRAFAYLAARKSHTAEPTAVAIHALPSRQRANPRPPTLALLDALRP